MRRTALKRTTGLKPVSDKRAAEATRITASRTGISPAAGRRTVPATRNSGPTPEVRRLVLERDGYRCTCDGYRCTCGCGRSIVGQRYSLGHRLRASQGGKAVPSNLLTFLGWGGEQCHGRIDSRRDPRDEANGLTVRSWQDPALVPVKIFGEHGSVAMAWLTDDGRYVFDPPAVAS